MQRLIEHGPKQDFLLTSSHEWIKEFINSPLYPTDLQDINREKSQFKPINDHVVEASVCFDRRFKWVNTFLRSATGGPLGKIANMWWRREYQKRGSVHVHMVVWVEDTNSIPNNVIVAEMPRYENCNINSIKELEQLRKAVNPYMIHKCNQRCLNSHGKCNYGYPFKSDRQQQQQQQRQQTRPNCYRLRRSEDEDACVVPFNLDLLLLWHGHVNVLPVTNTSWVAYLSKYISKAEPSNHQKMYDRLHEVEQYFNTRIVSQMEACDRLLDHNLTQSTLQCTYLPSDLTEFNHNIKTLKELRQLAEDSEDICNQNKIDKYLNRPEQYSNILYPDFFKLYNVSMKKRIDDDDEDDESDIDDISVDLQANNDLINIRKRNKPILVRFQMYKKNEPTEREKYYSQLLISTSAISKSDFDCKTKHFKFHILNTLKTFEQECHIRGLNEQQCPSWKLPSNRVDAEAEISRLTRSLLQISQQPIEQQQPLLNVTEYVLAVGELNETNLIGISEHERDELSKILQVDNANMMLNMEQNVYFPEDGNNILSIDEPIKLNINVDDEYCDDDEDFVVLEENTNELNSFRSIEDEIAYAALLFNELSFVDSIEDNNDESHVGDYENDITLDEPTIDNDVFVYDNSNNRVIMNDCYIIDENLDALSEYFIQRLDNIKPTFTNSQQFAYNHITTKWNNGDNVRCIISGAAGTGKSYVIDALRGYLFSYNRNHAVMAFSGSAADIIKGTTVHSFFGMKPNDRRVRISADSQRWKEISQIDTFIIDEFSMLELHLFVAIDQFLRAMCASNEPFGNKSFILVGDPGQLPAIEHSIYSNYVYQNQMSVMLLKENMRQQGNQQFFDLLNNLRSGQMQLTDSEYLYNHVLNAPFNVRQLENPERVSVIVSTTAERDMYNNMFLNAIPNQTATHFHAFDHDEIEKPIFYKKKKSNADR